MNNDKKRKIPIKTLLFYLIMLTVIASSITFSRHIIIVQGEDSISMASYVVEMDLSYDSQIINLQMEDVLPGSDHEYDIIVANYKDSKTSDISFQFFISVSTENILPLKITLQENWGEYLVFADSDDDGIVITSQYNVGQGSAQEVPFVLQISWDELDNDDSYANLSDTLTINVAWEQIT